MKIFATAMALVLAFPAAAQTAPAPAQHQDHQQHQQMQGHDAHAQHQAGQPGAQHQGGQHDGHAQGDGCCADRNNNGRMDCCEHMAQGTEQRGCCAEGESRPAAAPTANPNN